MVVVYYVSSSVLRGCDVKTNPRGILPGIDRDHHRANFLHGEELFKTYKLVGVDEFRMKNLIIFAHTWTFSFRDVLLKAFQRGIEGETTPGGYGLAFQVKPNVSHNATIFVSDRLWFFSETIVSKCFCMMQIRQRNICVENVEFAQRLTFPPTRFFVSTLDGYVG